MNDILRKYLLSSIPREGETGGTPGGDKPWHTGVDPAILGHWQNKAYDLTDPAKVAIETTKAAIEAQKFVGVPPEQILKLPKDAADEAGWKGVWERLGAPKEAKDYTFEGIKFGDNDLEPAFVDSMRAALAAAAVPKDKAPAIVKGVIKYLTDAEAAETANATAALAVEKDALTKSWGTNFEVNKLTAMQGAKRLGVDPSVIESLETKVGLGYSKVMEMFRKIGAATSEDTFVEGKNISTGPATVAGARARLAELQADKEWSSRLLKGGVPERREFDSLTQMIASAA